uniref:Death domain-containing protein n=1 Tax=Amphimedon queenslandica TaxID=400682 RepID=A0A1X7T7E2_AMPQE
MASLVPTDMLLQISDLAEVLQLLRRYGYSGVSYYNLGLFLGLSPNTMHLIEADHRGDTGRCLSECLSKWLLKADDVQKKGGRPSIYSLVSALRELGENGVAHEIDMETKLIKDMILPTNVQGEALLIEIKEAVCNDYQILKAFAEILCKVTATAEIGSTITKEYRKTYCIGESIQANDANGLKIFLPMNVTSEFKMMRLKFGQTFFKVGSIMMNNPQSLSIDNIKSVLRTYDKTLRPQVAQCQDLREVLELVCDNCQLDDISMLEFFVNEFNIEEAKVVIKEYKKAIEELKEIKLNQCLNETVSYASPLKCEIITIIVDKDANESTLSDVQRMSSALFKNSSQHVRLYVIRDGNSFTITCSFPLILSEQLITAALNNIDVLKENKVKRLTIGYCTVYEEIMRMKETAESFEKEVKSFQETQQKKLNVYIAENEKLTTKAIEAKHLLQEKESHLTECEEESMIIKQKAESLKEALDSKNKMLTASITESERFQAENEKLKEINKLLEEWLALFQSEKEKIKQYAEKPIVGKIEEQGREAQLATQREMEVEIKSLKREIKQKDDKIKEVQGKDFLLFEDDIYGNIIIDHPLIIKIVQSRQFQRLKKISTLGYTYENKTKANYTKLQHSIGMYYFAGEYVKQLQRKQPELNITESDVLCVQIAALCFNLGVGPFSHIFGLFLKEICQKQHTEKPWDNFSEASVNMFQYMLEDNEDLMDSFRRYFNNPREDITFITELMREERKMQCIQDKEFLYEIILNESQMNVKVIDYTTRDAAVLGAKINFKWRVFLAKVYVLRCDDGKLHICFHEDDLETYNDFFSTHSRLYRDLYYVRKIRIVALMIKVMLTRADNTELIQDTNSKVTISDAARSMVAYTQLTDSVLTLIRQSVKDPLVQVLLDCLDESKFIAEIGYIIPPEDWNKNPDDLKEAIVKATGIDEIECNLIIDLVLNGYEGNETWTQYYYRDDDSTGKWTDRWAQERYHANLPWRVFFVSGDRGLIKTVQE